MSQNGLPGLCGHRKVTAGPQLSKFAQAESPEATQPMDVLLQIRDFLFGWCVYGSAIDLDLLYLQTAVVAVRVSPGHTIAWSTLPPPRGRIHEDRAGRYNRPASRAGYLGPHYVPYNP